MLQRAIKSETSTGIKSWQPPNDRRTGTVRYRTVPPVLLLLLLCASHTLRAMMEIWYERTYGTVRYRTRIHDLHMTLNANAVRVWCRAVRNRFRRPACDEVNHGLLARSFKEPESDKARTASIEKSPVLMIASLREHPAQMHKCARVLAKCSMPHCVTNEAPYELSCTVAHGT